MSRLISITLAFALFAIVSIAGPPRAFAAIPQPPCTAATTHEPGCATVLAPLPVPRRQVAPLVFPGSGELEGLSPADIKSAYKLPASGPEQTVAIVDAFDDPVAESDMNAYRRRYALAECTTAGGCFKKVNQVGEATKYPSPNVGWAAEISNDLDMVSATCPGCHILLVEANSAAAGNLAAAANEAAVLKAAVISNSYFIPESATEKFSKYNSDYSHSGVVVVASSGDYGYDNYLAKGSTPSYPASIPSVIAVGGTRLEKASNSRGWSEEVWDPEEVEVEEGGKTIKRLEATGSGCSIEENKPAWQTDTGCTRRLTNDVAAVASAKSPVSYYDSYETRFPWGLFNGTSVAAPIVAGAIAQTNSYTRALGPDAFYQQTAVIFDLTAGSNGTCAEHPYFCTAEIGYDGPTGLGSMNGLPHEEWELQLVPNPSSNANRLYDVSCATSSACTAVGYYINSAGTEVTSAERWNGSSWSTQTTPNVSGAISSELRGVSCPTTTSCTAVGDYYNAEGARQTLAEGWNGSSWTIQSTTSLSSGIFLGVSCSAASACTAAGAYSSGKQVTLAERWNGTSWSVQTTPNPTGALASIFHDIACVSASACTAVGAFANSAGTDVTLGETWNGSTWSLQTTANPAGATFGVLDGIACTSTSFCMAAGEYRNSSEVQLPMAQRSNGSTWTLLSTPSPTGALASSFSRVMCIETTTCLAAGTYDNSYGTNAGFVDSWNGTTWSVESVPNPIGSRNSNLFGVSCAPACLAVGSYETTSAATLNSSETDIDP